MESEGVFVPQSSESSDTPLKRVDGEAVKNDAEDAQDPAPDYTIVDRFHTVGAFKIVSLLKCFSSATSKGFLYRSTVLLTMRLHLAYELAVQ